MHSQITTAFVLRKLPYGEGDAILTFLTQEGTRLTAFAQKASLSKKRFGTSLDFFNEVEIEWKSASHGSLPRLVNADLKNGFENLRQDLTKFAVACYLSEVILEFLQETQDAPEVYHFLKETLHALNAPTSFQSQVLPQLEHRILDLFGFRPTLSNCAKCHVPLKSKNDTYHFEGQAGGVVCHDCAKQLKSSSLNSHPLRHQVIERLLSKEANPALLWPADEVNEARRVLEFFIQYTAGKPIKSLKFLSDLL